jgi:hypothetical protein
VKSEPLSKEAIEAKILAYRFEGKSSIESISRLMKRENLPFSAVGTISQTLTSLGSALSNTLKNEGETQLLVFADDEIFSKSSPILITVDPVSSAILSIELTDHRTAEAWKDHLSNLVANGFSPRLIVSDAGGALKAAHSDIFADIPWQLDGALLRCIHVKQSRLLPKRSPYEVQRNTGR